MKTTKELASDAGMLVCVLDCDPPYYYLSVAPSMDSLGRLRRLARNDALEEAAAFLDERWTKDPARSPAERAAIAISATWCRDLIDKS
jgi:hypothetical protein